MATNSDFFSRLIIEGGSATFQNEELILSASLDLTVDQASELTFTLNDPGWKYLLSFGEKGPLEKLAQYEDLKLAVVGYSFDGGPAGLGGSALRLQPQGIFKCRKIVGPLTRENISPTDFAKDSAANCGMEFVGEESPVRPSISRDVGEENAKEEVTEWTTLKRLAAEEGFLIFESLNTLYFASPQWLFDNQKEYTVGLGDSVNDDAMRLLAIPTINISSSTSVSDELTFQLPISSAGSITPGNSIKVLGIPKPMGEEKLLVTSVKYPLAGVGVVDITAKKPWIIEKQALPGTGDDGTGGGGGNGATGPGPDLRNVTTPGEGGLTPAATALKKDIAARFGVTDIGGYRAEDGYGEHSTGRALDVMTYSDSAKGTAIKDYCVANANNFGLNWCIWQQALWYPDGSRSGMEDRGNPTQNHYDHVHVFIKY